MDLKVSSTIGFELAHNDLLAESDEDAFVERATAKLGPQPPNFQAIVSINRGPLSMEAVETLPMTPRQVEERRKRGALLVDVRTALQFDEAHIPDAVSIPAVEAGFGSKLAWLGSRDQEIVLVGRDDDDAGAAARLAASVGITSVSGVLAGGMTSWRQERRPTERVERLTVAELRERARQDGPQILDVRERSEWDEKHIAGSVHVPYHDLNELPGELDRERPIAAICSSGQRSGVAASLLRRQGAQQVIHVVDGGVGTWEELGGPIA